MAFGDVAAPIPVANWLRRIRNLVRKLGPGLITGAADDDPSGIATYSQVGAQFGYGMLWTMLYSCPLMAGIQEISARVGRVTGRGIAGNIERYYSPRLAHAIVALVIVANIVNLGADIRAMGQAVEVLVGGPPAVYILAFGFLCLVLQLTVSYSRFAIYLKWLTLTLFAYVATAFVVHVDMREVLGAMLWPALAFDRNYVIGIIAVFGTTLSPYLLFWQASQEVEEVQSPSRSRALKHAPRQAPHHLSRIRLDTYIGMAMSNLVGFCIILTAAATLHVHGDMSFRTSAEAAQALKPLAGDFAFALFAAGIIGTGLLAVPVLSGSAAYAVCEAFNWPVALTGTASRSRRFYVIVAVATLIGLLLNVLNIDLVKALFWAAVLNGIVETPVMVVMMLMATNTNVMGDFAVERSLAVIGWLATAVMCLTMAAMVVELLT